MKHTEQLDKIAPAFAKAQASIEGASKDKTNPAFRSKYADLASCWDACREALTANGLSIIQAPSPAENGVTLVTRILHSSGQWIEDEGIYLPAVKKDPQGFGSALTYARRYGLCAMVGISPEDDDGNAATKSVQKAAITPTSGVWEEMDAEEQQFLQGIADKAITMPPADAIKYIKDQKLDADESTALWTRFDSKFRAAMKAANTQKESANGT